MKDEGVKLPKTQVVDLTKEGIEVVATDEKYTVTNSKAKMVTTDATRWLEANHHVHECSCASNGSTHPFIVVRITDHKSTQYIGREYVVCSARFRSVEEDAHIKKLLKQSGETQKKNRWTKLDITSSE